MDCTFTPSPSSTPSTVHYNENNVMCAVTNKTLESQSRLNELLTDDGDDFANDFIFTLSLARASNFLYKRIFLGVGSALRAFWLVFV